MTEFTGSDPNSNPEREHLEDPQVREDILKDAPPEVVRALELREETQRLLDEQAELILDLRHPRYAVHLRHPRYTTVHEIEEQLAEVNDKLSLLSDHTPENPNDSSE